MVHTLKSKPKIHPYKENVGNTADELLQKTKHNSCVVSFGRCTANLLNIHTVFTKTIQIQSQI